jgi:hypothetical protein
LQTGWLVAANVQGRIRPQALQAAAGSRQQFTQMPGLPSRPRTATGAVLPQIPQAR